MSSDLKAFKEDLEKLKNNGDKQKYILTQQKLLKLCQKVIEIFNEESNVIIASTPINVCGDIHGQFFDVLELFRKGGEIPNNTYLFIGDFVDRGSNSIETIEYLLLLKVLYPDNIILLRGNHESRMTTQMYGFYDECQRKYGNMEPWRVLCEVFDYMPLACLIDGEIFCIHGGLSPSIKLIDQIRTIDRKQEIPLEGPLTDLLWSDPDQVDNWVLNPRNAGWLFGASITKQFNLINNISLVVRAHQLVQEGYNYWFDEALVSIWSAPNYCYRMGNKAVIMKLNEQLQRQFLEFEAQEISSKQDNPKKVLPYFL